MALKDFITVDLQVALTTAPGDAPTWTTIASNTTKKLRSWSVTRGRQSPLDTFPPSRASFVLDNRDRVFDPLHSSGTYYGNLLPGKRIRIRITYNAVVYTRFDGYVTGWPQTYLLNGKDSVVALTAIDGQKGLAKKIVPSPWYQTVTAETPLAWYRLGERSGTEAADSSGNRRHGTYEGGAVAGSTSGLIFGDKDPAIHFDGVDDGVTLPLAVGLTGASYSIEAWIQPTQEVGVNDLAIFEQTGVYVVGLTQLIQVAVANSSDPTMPGGLVVNTNTAAGNGIAYSNVRVDDSQPHHIVFTRSVANGMQVYVDGVNATGFTSFGGGVDGFAPTAVVIGNATILTTTNPRFNGALDEVRLYDTELSAATVLAHYQAGFEPWADDTPGARFTRILDYVGTPAADRDIDTGSAVLQPAALEKNALVHLQDVALTEGGRFFISRDGKVTLIGRRELWETAVYNTSQATFGDGAGEQKYSDITVAYDDEKIINEARVSQEGGSEQVAADTASADAYGASTYSQPSLEQRARQVKDQADYIVSKNKDPAVRIEAIKILPLRDPTNLFPIVLGAELGYRYTVKRRPQGIGSAISQDVQLEGTTEAGDADTTYSFSWWLSPAEPNVFRWGVAGSGWGDGKWGY